MADTRTQRVTIAPNGDVYLGFAYDGGNTPLRYDPYDLSKPVSSWKATSFTTMPSPRRCPR